MDGTITAPMDIALRTSSTAPACRCCGAPLRETFAELGLTPLANSYVAPADAARMEPFYPLHALVCSDCRLVQLAEFESPQAIFSEYRYFSSVSEAWLRHAETYVERMVARFGLDGGTPVVEVASNDGYLLQYFARRGIPVLGIDPAANVARFAMARGIPTEVAFFNAATAIRLRAAHPQPMLMVANNVLAHVPDLHGFVEGFRILLAPGGVATFEFPHLLRLMQHAEFDTIYHEHFSYISLFVAERIFAQHGLTIFDLEELPTHGGSLRLFVRHAEDAAKAVTPAVEAMRVLERQAGLDGPDAYRGFAEQVVETKAALLDFLLQARRAGKRVVGYGAPAKGNTLLNYCGVGPELLPFTVDRSPHKQGLLLPGTRIPIRAPEAIIEARPDYVLILAWNLREEVAEQMSIIREWGGRFAVPIPRVVIF
ncbi:class I SAM-dependent methyltransferase [Belnapia sp. F-4-1]|uniref:class I SAM-dependent methyltransferase n=1 Tax=Belnapia sp. F-4-1 TaxID=1545443 RepID=UPI0009E02098|nr:class I SAM-dependent methyltransferase [Belnapia sp. F-4-1]